MSLNNDNFYKLLRGLRFDIRGIALREPALPALDRLGVTDATAIGWIDERAVGEPGPTKAAARTPVFQRTVEDCDRIARLERAAGDTALQQCGRRRTLKAPQCFTAILVLDVQVEP